MRLRLVGCTNFIDLSAVCSCESLERLTVPQGIRNIEFLRDMPIITHIGIEYQDGARTVFWKEYEANR